MFDDLEIQVKLHVGLAGAFFAAVLGTAARNVYVPGGFKWRRWVWDLPFAVTCALTVAGIGDLAGVNSIVVNGFAGAAGFLGPEWLDGFLKRQAAERTKKSGGADGDKQDA